MGMFPPLWFCANSSHTQDQFAYVKALDEVMLPYAEEDMPLKWMF